ncbi:apolipoprotein N-acyltransferase [Aliiroseovarius sp. F47248L]|uniref:apolipoprotein N-acyltransferase n=1 Tax=Aliiroseovarius sp. F47248L TaxID=2926420 RepID=UPI001FF55FE2|nr:apolipoprotein N-acyltransferase [Aliiroseovarius sp. F47248L]MCK0139606.1 apolipoprotein N-acyltransferase [Aliiroseovarius sp. F47248L]
MTKRNRLATVRTVLAICALGGVAALGHAPFNWPVLTLIGLAAAFYFVLKSENSKQAGLRAWVLGVGYFGVTLSWLVEPFFVDAARHGWMAPFALFFMAAGLALLWGASAALAHCLASPVLRWLSLALTMSGAEWVRGWLFTGFPWGNPGHVWIDTTYAQLASYVGASGLGAATILLAVLMARFSATGASIRTRFTLLALGVVLVVGGLVVGVTRGQNPLPADRNVTLRLVQPNAPQHLKWDPDHAYDFVTRQIEFTAAEPAPGQPRPDLVIWPETAVPTLLDWTDDLRIVMAEAAQGAPVLFGVQRGDAMQYYNSLALIDPEGQVQATYDKHHLVPFGEYIPLGDWLEQFGISAFASRAGNGYSAGPGARLLDTGLAGAALPLICYEAVFPRDILAVPERADWILHATNDAWFGDYTMPYQHLAQARFRAIEFGLPVIRVANTGISAVIDARGQLRATLALGQAGFLDQPLPGADQTTPYSRHGDMPLAVLITVALCSLLVRRVVKAR